METLISPQTLIIKLITTLLFSYSLTTSQTIDLGPLLPPISAPSLIPDLLSFADQKLAVVFPVIQAFKSTIISDPLGVTDTWTGSDICSYTGFYCGATPENASATAVASVDFNGFGLSAPSLDAFLAGLPDLAVFHANSNKFSGAVLSPAAAAALPHLFELDVSNNAFRGSAAAKTSLSFLDARFNAFSGPVPPELFLAETLDFLLLNDNAFSAAIPDALGSSRARYVSLANNMLSGPIPRSVGGAAETAVELMLRGNALSGCLPYELGLLRKAVLLDAADNLLTGPIPMSLRCMDSLEVLDFAGNRLFGAVPEGVCGLASLSNLSLAGNYFTSVGPECRRLIRLGVLDVRRNCIPGLPDQRPGTECSLFFVAPRSCGHPSWFTLVPCQPNPSKKKPAATRRRAQRKLITYAALSRRKLTMEF